MGNRGRIPVVVVGIDIRKLPLGPEEAFVMSRVDGRTPESELILATGLDASRVSAALERLAKFGAIRFSGPAAPESPSGTPGATSEPPRTLPSPALPSSTRSPPPAPLADKIPLGEATLAELEATLRRLRSQDLYAVLGVERSATKKDIKDAYFAIIGRYHPDRYYGAQLGAAKPLLQEIFARLTEAHDTLTKASLRARYDEELPPLPAVPPLPKVPTNPRTQSRPSVRGPSVSALDPEARRIALARKLSGSLPAARPSATMEAMVAPTVRRSADTIPAPREPTNGFVITAKDEESPLARASALRRAVALAPLDPTLRRQLDLAQLAADRQQFTRLCLEADRARDTGRFAEAVELYARAARATDDADLYLAAARCSLSKNDNPRAAVELARAGIAIAPEHAALHSLLGRIYADAGMMKSALAELRKAKHLNPSDQEATALLQRLEKG